MRVVRFFTLACAAAVVVNAAPASKSDIRKAESALARTPLRFEANRGQLDPAVRYSARAVGYTLHLTEAGASLSFPDASRLDLALVGASAAPRIEGLDRMPVRTSYFVGRRDQWRTGVDNYERVRYRQVYPGIDVVYYGNESRLEYDFVVAPGADPNQIRMRFAGAGRVAIGPEGDLMVETAAGRVFQRKPVLYQGSGDSRRQVAGSYYMTGNGEVAVRTGSYDRSRPLVIDPLLVFSSYFGGTAEDSITGVYVDPKGLLYIAGTTKSDNLPATANAYSDERADNRDVFIAILDASAEGNYALKYFSYFGGGQDDKAAAMAVNSSKHVIVVGSTTSTDFPLAGVNVVSEADGSTWDGFMFEFAPDLEGTDALWYSTYFGGELEDYITDVAVDANNAVYFIGTTRSTKLPLTDGAYAAVLWDAQDAFLAKVDPNNQSAPLRYSTYLGGELSEEGRSIAVGPNGLVYFACNTNSTQFPWAGAPLHSTLLGQEDAIIGVMDMNLSGEPSLVYCTYFGGADLDQVKSIAFDPSGRLLITGYTFSSDFPITFDAMQSTVNGNGDAFVSIVDPSQPASFVVYSTFLGGSGSDVALAVMADNGGNIYVTGYTLSTDFPHTDDAMQPNFRNGAELFLAKIKPGEIGRPGLLFSTYLGDAGYRVPTGLTLGSDGTLYIVGYTNVGLPSAGSAARPWGGGSSDGFIVAITELGGQPIRASDRRSLPRKPRF